MNKGLVWLTMGCVFIGILLAGCGRATSKQAGFPTGRFLLKGQNSEGVYYGADGTWYGFSDGQHIAEGTYHIEGDLYVEDANPKTACPTSATYRYSLDGKNLSFKLVGEDTCENRRTSYDGVTYVLGQ